MTSIDDLLTGIRDKSAGELIKSDDWDALVAALDALTARVDALVMSSSTVHADPGDDLQEAVDALPAEGGELSLAAGEFELGQPVSATGRQRILISGAGAATVIRSPASEAALVFERCHGVDIRRLRVESGTAATPAAKAQLNGALTFLGCTDVVVSDCSLACPNPTPGLPESASAFRRAQSCITVRSLGTDRPDRVRIEQSQLDVGAWQTGILLLDVGQSIIAENHLRMNGAPAGPDAVGQGIVVGGAEVGVVRILDNLVEDAVQGIHVGVSRSSRGPRQAAEAVVLIGNVVRSFVPASYRRERHAIFVGNTRSVRVSGTIASLRRTDPVGEEPITGVEAIRLHGVFGPFLLVSDTSVTAFSVGVALEPLETIESATWVVRDTMADGATTAVRVRDGVPVELLRNNPEAPPAPTVGPPAQVLVTPPVFASPRGAPAVVTATVLDVAGLPVPAVPVRFAVVGVNNQQSTVVTNDQGRATFSYVGTVSGLDRITAFVDKNANSVLDVGEPFGLAMQTFLAPEPASVTFARPIIAASVGTQVALAAIVRDASANPIAGVPLTFAIAGPNAGVTAVLSQATNAQGVAELRYTGANPGTDTITAAVGTGAALKQGTATVTYLPLMPSAITLTPSQSTSPVASQYCVTATVTDAAGKRLAGVPIGFDVRGPNRRREFMLTNTSGEARFCYTGTAAGEDRITAFVDANKNEVQDPRELFALAVQTFVVIAPHLTLVPSLMGMTRGAAATTLSQRSLVLGRVTLLADPPRTTPLGNYTGPFVVSQAPTLGARVVPGSAVNVSMRRRFIPAFGSGILKPGFEDNLL
jgi:hypothetical protein